MRTRQKGAFADSETPLQTGARRWRWLGWACRGAGVQHHGQGLAAADGPGRDAGADAAQHSAQRRRVEGHGPGAKLVSGLPLRVLGGLSIQSMPWAIEPGYYHGGAVV